MSLKHDEVVYLLVHPILLLVHPIHVPTTFYFIFFLYLQTPNFPLKPYNNHAKKPK